MGNGRSVSKHCVDRRSVLLSSASNGGLQARGGIPEDKHVQIPCSASNVPLLAQDASRPGMRGWSRRDDKSRPARATIRGHNPHSAT